MFKILRMDPTEIDVKIMCSWVESHEASSQDHTRCPPEIKVAGDAHEQHGNPGTVYQMLIWVPIFVDLGGLRLYYQFPASPPSSMFAWCVSFVQAIFSYFVNSLSILDVN